MHPDVKVISDEEGPRGRAKNRLITRAHLLEILETQTNFFWFPSEEDYEELKKVEAKMAEIGQHFPEILPLPKKQGFKVIRI